MPSAALWSLQHGHTRYEYRGVPTLKCPFDLALYALLIWRQRPRTIIEIGSHRGGSALWLADQLRSYGIDGRVWSYDLAPVTNLHDERVTFGRADAFDLGAVLTPDHLAALPRPLLVIEDSLHQRASSLAVAEFFAEVLAPGEYLVVEDAIVTDLGIAEHFDGGPGAAIAQFLAAHPEWEVDRGYCDYYGPNLTWNVNGYLRRKA